MLFTEAYAVYRKLLCQIGGGSPTIEGRLFGSGCLISNHHILTARHVVNTLPDFTEWPVVLKYDGLFQCDILFESSEHDLMILEANRRIATSSQPAPTEFPEFVVGHPKFGSSVGHIARLKSTTEDGRTNSHTYFSPSTVSMYAPSRPDEATMYVLANGIVQPGFSGCPVFGADRTLHGILVQCYQFPIHSENQITQIHSLPIMSPVFPIRAEIDSALNRDTGATL